MNTIEMKRTVPFLLIATITIHFSDAGCPPAKFEFENATTKTFYNFIESSVGNIGSLESCPYTGRPYVYLPCYPNSSWGDEPYFSSCLKPPEYQISTTTITTTTTLIVTSTSPVIENPYNRMTIGEVANLTMITADDAPNLLSYLNQDKIAFNSPSEMASAVRIIDRVTATNTNSEIEEKLYSVADKLLSPMSTFQSHQTQEFTGSIVKLLSSLETFVQNSNEPLSLSKNDPWNKSFVENNLAVFIVNKPNSHVKPIVGFVFDSTKNRSSPMVAGDIHENSTTVTFDSQALIGQNRLAFVVYDQRNRLFDEKQHRVVTRVVSVTVDKPLLTSTIHSLVKIHFLLDDIPKEKKVNLTCAYWHIFDNLTAQWSTKGCQLINSTEQSATCECDHLTHFAVLMDINQTSLPKTIELILSIITIIGLLLSSIGLCLTILTFILFKKLRRHFSQKSLLLLSINLLFVNIFFSIIGLRSVDQLTHIPCIVVASLLHYFIISSFSWMFIMALIQYLLFVKVFPSSISAFTRKAAAFAQIVPLIPVIVVLVIDPSNYTKRTDKICWLSQFPFYFSFILPIFLYIVVNSVLFSIVAHSLLCGKTGQQLRSTQMAESQRLSRFSVALSCFVVLGLTWIFGLFAIGPIRVLFQILFCIFASLTGFFIFILYIVTSRAKRTCWSNTFKSLGLPSIYSPASSSSSGFVGGIGSKEFSTSSTSDHQKVPSRHLQFPSQPQHFIDAYMPSSPPPPPPPPPQPPLLIEGDDPLCSTALGGSFYEPRHVWAPQTNYIYETNQPTTSLDDYSLFYASHHDATKL